MSIRNEAIADLYAGIEFRDAEIARLRADADRLAQALDNLIHQCLRPMNPHEPGGWLMILSGDEGMADARYAIAVHAEHEILSQIRPTDDSKAKP